jgi:hypothetical protein
MRTGQMQVFTVVLLAVIIMGLVGAAYMWAVPIIERNAGITEYTVAERFALDLDEKIISLANSGTGEYTLDIPTGLLRIEGPDYPGPDNNSMMFDFFANIDMLCNNTGCTSISGGVEIPIETDNLSRVGTYGEDEPRVITLTGQDSGTGKDLTMRIFYRNLLGSSHTYRIAVCPDTGCDTAVNGTGRVMLTFDRRTEDPGFTPPLVTNYITVKMI